MYIKISEVQLFHLSIIIKSSNNKNILTTKNSGTTVYVLYMYCESCKEKLLYADQINYILVLDNTVVSYCSAINLYFEPNHLTGVSGFVMGL